jgi:hypothetical protein
MDYLKETRISVTYISDENYQNNKHAIALDKFDGCFPAFDLNIEWQKTFKSILPNRFLLEFVNWDFDAIKSIVHIDNVIITSSPID